MNISCNTYKKGIFYIIQSKDLYDLNTSSPNLLKKTTKNNGSGSTCLLPKI